MMAKMTKDEAAYVKGMLRGLVLADRTDLVTSIIQEYATKVLDGTLTLPVTYKVTADGAGWIAAAVALDMPSQTQWTKAKINKALKRANRLIVRLLEDIGLEWTWTSPLEYDVTVYFSYPEEDHESTLTDIAEATAS